MQVAAQPLDGKQGCQLRQAFDRSPVYSALETTSRSPQPDRHRSAVLTDRVNDDFEVVAAMLNQPVELTGSEGPAPREDK